MFRSRLGKLLDLWTETGLLAPGQADRLMADFEARSPAYSLAGVLGLLAALLLGAGVVVLIAANWELFPRIARVLLICTLIAAALMTAAVLQRKGHSRLADAALLFSVLCFGAGIALVGQMYHLSGDERDASLLWAVGGLLTAIVFAAPITSVLAALLACAHLWFAFDGDWSPAIATTALALAVVAALASFRARSVLSRQIVWVLMIGWLIWQFSVWEPADPGYVIAAVGAGLLALGSAPGSPLVRLVGLHGEASFYGLALLLSGLAVIQFDFSFDTVANPVPVIVPVLVLAVAVGAISLAGRANAAIRWLAYAGFAAETFYLATVTIGTMLGTSGFLLVGGVILALSAWAVLRLERRLKSSGESR